MSKKPTEVPDAWRPLMERRGLTYNGKPSMRALSTASGIAPTTISRAMRGVGEITTATVDGLARALAVPPSEVRALIDGAEQSPFVPHRDADLLDEDERNAINELIRLLALRRKRHRRRDVDPAVGPAGLSLVVGVDDLDDVAANEDDPGDIEGEQSPHET